MARANDRRQGKGKQDNQKKAPPPPRHPRKKSASCRRDNGKTRRQAGPFGDAARLLIQGWQRRETFIKTGEAPPVSGPPARTPDLPALRDRPEVTEAYIGHTLRELWRLDGERWGARRARQLRRVLLGFGVPTKASKAARRKWGKTEAPPSTGGSASTLQEQLVRLLFEGKLDGLVPQPKQFVRVGIASEVEAVRSWKYDSQSADYNERALWSAEEFTYFENIMQLEGAPTLELRAGETEDLYLLQGLPSLSWLSARAAESDDLLVGAGVDSHRLFIGHLECTGPGRTGSCTHYRDVTLGDLFYWGRKSSGRLRVPPHKCQFCRNLVDWAYKA